MDDRHVDLSSSIAEEDWFVAGEGAGAGEVAQFIASCDLQRDLHLVDLFSASGAAARWWKGQGYGAQACDITHAGNWGMASREGFMATLAVCLRLLP